MNFILLFALSYALLSLFIWVWWKRSPVSVISQDYKPNIPISLIIALRNEQVVIPNLVRQIQALNYPTDLVEVILINDFSTDRTAELLDQINHPLFRVIHLSDIHKKNENAGGKKRALELGIKHSAHSWLVTTDADCSFSPNWLRTLSWHIQHSGAVCLLGQVCFTGAENLFGWFQRFDQLGLTAYTGAGVESGYFHMGNGANLAFSKMAFESIGGYSEHMHRASGDDIFLVQAIARHFPGRIRFIKHVDAVVTTLPETSLQGFVNQRIRWGSKASYFKEKTIKFVLGYQFFYACLVCLAALNAVIFGGYVLLAFGILAASKLVFDAWILFWVARELKQPFNLIFLLPASLLHSFYLCLGGVMSIFTQSYEWKGRQLS